MYTYDLPLWVTMIESDGDSVKLYSYGYHDGTKALLLFTDDDSVDRFISGVNDDRIGYFMIETAEQYLSILQLAIREGYSWVVFDSVVEREQSIPYDIYEVYNEYQTRE